MAADGRPAGAGDAAPRAATGTRGVLRDAGLRHRARIAATPGRSMLRRSVFPLGGRPMPDLFTPFTLKDVTLRNRIAMSPMTMYRAEEGRMGDYHVMLMGSRAAGGFGLVFPEQIAITPDGRTGTCCAGIWDDDQVEGLARICAL